MTKHWERGQTLIEVLLAFSASILILSAIIIGITSSLSNTQYTKNQNLANSYAQEGMAVIRQIRASGDLNEISYPEGSTYCLGQDSMELKKLNLPATNCGQQSPVGKIFSREVKFDHESSDCSEGIPPTPTPTPSIILKGSKVTITVSWFDDKCPSGEDNIYCHKVELISCFSKY